MAGEKKRSASYLDLQIWVYISKRGQLRDGASFAPLSPAMSDDDEENPQFGSATPWSEPTWYNSSNPTPYYTKHHIAFRAKMRAWVDKEVTPFAAQWETDGEIPPAVFKRAAEVGLLPATVNWPDDIPGVPPRPEGYDGFFSLIAFDELARCANGGVVWGVTGGLGIGLPPVVHFGSDELKTRVAAPCLRGEAFIALAVSEPTAGSDVANIKTTAVSCCADGTADDDGEFYVVNGLKKWITCGMFADFFTVAVRTGGKESGFGGVELLLVSPTQRSLPEPVCGFLK